MDFSLFPQARYKGCKRRLLPFLHSCLATYETDDVLDLYSGSGIVSLMFRQMGKRVHSNDFLKSCSITARALLGYDGHSETPASLGRNLRYLLEFDSCGSERLIGHHFDGIYFTAEENHQLDLLCQKKQLLNPRIADLYLHLVAQACLKKRPYNLFDRPDLETRLRDIKRASRNHVTWEAGIIKHAEKALLELNKLTMAEPVEHLVTTKDACELDHFDPHAGLVYIDPPSLSSKGIAFDYANGYHFLEGLSDYSLFAHADYSKPHRPIIQKSSLWSTPEGAKNAISDIADHFQSGVIAISHRADSAVSTAEVVARLDRPGRRVLVNNHNNDEDLLITSEPS